MVLFVRENMFKRLAQEETALPSPVYNQTRATHVWMEYNGGEAW